MIISYLPILGIAGEHHWILRLADLSCIVILDLLDILLGLDAVILGKGTLVTGTAGVGEEVRTNRLDAALSCGRELANSLEVFFGRPALGKSW